MMPWTNQPSNFTEAAKRFSCSVRFHSAILACTVFCILFRSVHSVRDMLCSASCLALRSIPFSVPCGSRFVSLHTYPIRCRSDSVARAVRQISHFQTDLLQMDTRSLKTPGQVILFVIWRVIMTRGRWHVGAHGVKARAA